VVAPADMLEKDLSILPVNTCAVLRSQLRIEINHTKKYGSANHQQITKIFLNFWMNFFYNYRSFLKRNPDAKDGPSILFDREAFEQSQPKAFQKFIQVFKESQMFEQFVRGLESESSKFHFFEKECKEFNERRLKDEQEQSSGSLLSLISATMRKWEKNDTTSDSCQSSSPSPNDKKEDYNVSSCSPYESTSPTTSIGPNKREKMSFRSTIQEIIQEKRKRFLSHFQLLPNQSGTQSSSTTNISPSSSSESLPMPISYKKASVTLSPSEINKALQDVPVSGIMSARSMDELKKRLSQLTASQIMEQQQNPNYRNSLRPNNYPKNMYNNNTVRMSRRFDSHPPTSDISSGGYLDLASSGFQERRNVQQEELNRQIQLRFQQQQGRSNQYRDTQGKASLSPVATRNIKPETDLFTGNNPTNPAIKRANPVYPSFNNNSSSSTNKSNNNNKNISATSNNNNPNSNTCRPIPSEYVNSGQQTFSSENADSRSSPVLLKLGDVEWAVTMNEPNQSNPYDNSYTSKSGGGSNAGNRKSNRRITITLSSDHLREAMEASNKFSESENLLSNRTKKPTETTSTLAPKASAKSNFPLPGSHLQPHPPMDARKLPSRRELPSIPTKTKTPTSISPTVSVQTKSTSSRESLISTDIKHHGNSIKPSNVAVRPTAKASVSTPLVTPPSKDCH